ncbi:MAG: phenylalanine--tRNA ligase subunit beta [Verrucomicrobiales bacterium]|nr:phenylalanine--tRNA ligase subunit beta [Verrucomicrobiales bacterium]
MKVSLSWLSTHLDLSGRSLPELSDLLTFAGIEVEGIEQKGVTSDKVIVAQIRDFVPHPDADKLSVCQVDDGSGSPRQIVCGAKNFKAGDKVPLALPGAELPGGFTIKEGKLRGVASMGMMCSGREIGLGQEDAGLLILDADAPVGTPLRDLVEADVLLDLEITPNRPDLLSHTGLARELAALTGLHLKTPPQPSSAPSQTATDTEIQLTARDGCPFYTARILRGVRVGPSPDWLKARLESIGLRPINNIVDITNYVLMELGQPLHAFDLDKLQGGIVVRRAAAGETLLALDGETYPLEPEDLVIADSQTPVALAGVMGGELSSVTEATRDILLESAWFEPSGVRRTSRRLTLHSDSSYRFERGVDPHQVAAASDLATRLILDLAGGSAEPARLTAGEPPAAPTDVTLDETRLRQLLGIPDYDAAEGHAILEKLGLSLVEKSATASTWRIPTHRLDLIRSADLIEEVARVIGLDRVPTRHQGPYAPSSESDQQYDRLMALRQALQNRGCHEAQTLRLISATQMDQVLGAPPPKGVDFPAIPVKNPLSEDLTHLRPSLIPGLIATAALNIRQGAQRLRFFEVGRVFLPLPKGNTREEERLGILLSGPEAPASWAAREPRAIDWQDLVGLVENLPGLAGQALEIKRAEDRPGFLLFSILKAGNRNIGWIAQLHPRQARHIDARHPVYVAELIPTAFSASSGPARFEEMPRFPAITRDVSMEAPASLAHADVAKVFAKANEPLLIDAVLFDQFQDPTGSRMPADRKSLAYSLTYRSPARTLETKEVDEAHARVLAALEKALPITIRR